MDDDGLNMRNWVYYEPSRHLNLQLMPNVSEQDTKSFLPGRDPTVMVSANGAFQPRECRRDPTVMVSANGAFHPRDRGRDPTVMVSANGAFHPRDRGHDPTVMVSANGAFHPRDCGSSGAPVHNHMDYARDSWVNHRENFLNMSPANPNYTVMPVTSGAHSLHMVQPPEFSKDESTEESIVQKEGNPSKKRQSGGAPKTPKPKKSKKGPSMPKDNSNTPVRRVKPAKKNIDVVINGIDMDISGIPIPTCSCTGTPQQCYRWGCGGWQSACCTTTMSIYPLPMSTKRRGARIAGRKMSQSAFKKVLEKLAAEGYNFSNPIDLRTHWAKHGTNKFVTIR